jgi:hypothetical protein
LDACNFNAGQAPDPRPGSYYVTARTRRDEGLFSVLLRGPFEAHSDALAAVRETMLKACDLDAKGRWYEYGTCRMPGAFGTTGDGILNKYF